MTEVEKLQKELIEQVSEKVKELQKTEQTYIPHQFSEEEKENLLPREEEQYLFNKIKEKILNHFDLNKHNPKEVYDYMKSMRDDFETDEIEWDYDNYKYTPYEHSEHPSFMSPMLDLRTEIDKDKCPVLYQDILGFFGDWEGFYTGEKPLTDKMLQEIKNHNQDKTKDKLDFGIYLHCLDYDKPYEWGNIDISYIDSYTMELSDEYCFTCSDEFSKAFYDLTQQVRTMCFDKDFEDKLQNLIKEEQEQER